MPVQKAWADNGTALPAIPGVSRDDDNEYIAFRDLNEDTNEYPLTLTIQDQTMCKNDPAECNAKTGKGLKSKSFTVAYCLNFHKQMPYDLATTNGNDRSVNGINYMYYDKKTGLYKGKTQRYWRFFPAERLIRDYIVYNQGTDEQYRRLKKVFYHGYHGVGVNDSQWQINNNISDGDFRRATQYAIWHFTDNMKWDKMPGRAANPNDPVRKAYDYLLDADNVLEDAPASYDVRFFHTNERESDLAHYYGKGYQNLVSLPSGKVPDWPNKPIPNKARITFKKVDQITSAELEGVKIRIYAISKQKDDDTIIFDETMEVTNVEDDYLDLEVDNTYYIEELEVQEGYTKRNFELNIDKDGVATVTAEYSDHSQVKIAEKPADEDNVVAAYTMTLKNTRENNVEAGLKTTVSANGMAAAEDKAAEVKAGEAKVIDKIDYQGLIVGKEYTFVGALVKVGKANKVTEIKKVEVRHTPKSEKGSLEVNFETVTLEPGAKYVVFETAESTEPVLKDPQNDANMLKHVVKHEDLEDLAQTVVVVEPDKPTPPAPEYPDRSATPDPDPKITTTVEAGKIKSNNSAPAQVESGSVSVVDHVNYRGLVTGEEYIFAGKIMKIDGDNLTEVTRAEKTVVAESTVGTIDIDFGQVKLEAGAKYVVFETATSVQEIIPTDRSDLNSPKAKQILKHEDPKDLAQTIVVLKPDQPTPPTPPVPEVPPTPGVPPALPTPPAPDKPENPGNLHLANTGMENALLISAISIWALGLGSLCMVRRSRKRSTR